MDAVRPPFDPKVNVCARPTTQDPMCPGDYALETESLAAVVVSFRYLILLGLVVELRAIVFRQSLIPSR